MSMNEKKKKKKNQSYSYSTLEFYCLQQKARVASDDIFRINESKSLKFSFCLSDSQSLFSTNLIAIHRILSLSFIPFGLLSIQCWNFPSIWLSFLLSNLTHTYRYSHNKRFYNEICFHVFSFSHILIQSISNRHVSESGNTKSKIKKMKKRSVWNDD